MARIVTASAGSITPMYRRDANGAVVSVMPDIGEYQTPPKGTRARMTLSGISEEFELTSQFSEQPVTKVRVEFTIDKVSGNAKMLEGKRFTDLYTLSTGPKSNLGKLLGALRGREIAKGEDVDIDAFIGASFVTVTTQSADGQYAGISVDGIELASIRLPEGGSEPLPPALQPDPPVEAVDPFGLDEL